MRASLRRIPVSSSRSTGRKLKICKCITRLAPRFSAIRRLPASRRTTRTIDLWCSRRSAATSLNQIGGTTGVGSTTTIAFFFGFVLGFVGPVFWPYAYDDYIDYVFWPYAYDTFWPYAYDDVFQGIYGGYAPQYYAPEDVYAYAGAPGSSAAYASATGVSRRSAALPAARKFARVKRRA